VGALVRERRQDKDVLRLRRTEPRSYVTAEPDGTVGTICIHQATSPEAIRLHASRADLPVDEIVKVTDTVIVRPDPALIAT